MQPGRQELAGAAVVEEPGQLPHHERAGVVPRETGVAVGVVDPRRADHERRVAHDLVEPAPRDRGEPFAPDQFHVQFVEPERRRGQRQRAGRDVGRGDLLRVPGGVQCLDAVAGADVEQAADLAAAGGPDQAERGVPDAEHVVFGHGRAQDVGVEVGDDPPRAFVVAVRADVETGPVAVGGGHEQRRGDRVIEGQWRESGLDVLLRFGRPQQEQPDQRAEFTRVAGRAIGEFGFAAAEGAVRGTEGADHAVGVVPRPAEGVPQPRADVVGQVGEGRSCAHGG